MLRVAAEVEALARGDQERVAVGGGKLKAASGVTASWPPRN
jgi:hypothetical protein